MSKISRVASDDSVTRFEDESMRIGWGTYQQITDEQLQLAKQLGIEDILLTTVWREGVETTMPKGRGWDPEEVIRVRDKIESYGLRLYAFETIPIPLYRILLSEDRFDEFVGELQRTIRSVGAAGVPILGYSGLPPGGPVRTDTEKEIRGGAKAYAYDGQHAALSDVELDREYTESELWDRYEEVLSRLLPVAEEAGVVLSLHPSDPPVEEIDGLPLLFRDRETFDRAMGLVESDNHGLKLCLGCWSEMGEDIPEVIRHFEDDIVYVHFRDVVGAIPEFYETFIDDENSNFDEYVAMKTLEEIGFTGVMTPDHVPRIEGESESEHGGEVGRAFTVGYLKGLVRAVSDSG